MDTIFQQILPGLGAFGPFAVLAWYIIRTQSDQNKAKDERIYQLTDKSMTAMLTVSQALTELKAELRNKQ